MKVNVTEIAKQEILKILKDKEETKSIRIYVQGIG